MSNSYITLNNSNSSLTKKFRVVMGGYQKTVEKVGAQRLTVTGKTDNQVGPAKTRFTYLIQVYETDPTDPTKSDGNTEGYGTLDHLSTFFSYDSPGGTPSNAITLTDFDGTSYTVYLIGTFTPRPLGSAVDGLCAVYNVPVQMLETT